MIRKTPIIDSPVGPADLAYAACRAADAFTIPELEEAMSRRSGCRYVHLADSGIAAFYIILKAISAGSYRTEVVLPAYTAGSLVVAVRKAGLKPVLCDVSMKDFNADTAGMLKAVSDRTLAVTGIHMFGIESSGMADLKRAMPPEVVLIEDCCQSMGTTAKGRAVGTFGDVAFFSFNRGKNLPVCGGGCITTNDAGISEAIVRAKTTMGCLGHRFDIVPLFRMLAFAPAVNPYIYGIFYGLISRFKDNAPPADFDTGGISYFQAALALSLLKRFDSMAARRYENGQFLTTALKGMKGLTVPEIETVNRTAFNRFPVVFNERPARDRAAVNILRAGVENSRMYLRPLHHMFDLGYHREEFPNACAVAEGMLALPVHPSVRRGDLSRAVEAIREALK